MEKEVVFLLADIYNKRRSKYVRKGKLGHVEKPSCNDPNQGQAAFLLLSLSLIFIQTFFCSTSCTTSIS